ncbi:MAG: folylpolyglutamate synthase/dihydrofolate synthase family protein [Candidatus Binatus sp.]|uniref:bifunctional folylpolyglutamate synthase/dihydrofolate synthase n=1 Tax=Candidatus Binatus sp. TaxID=2811406 RepID=UPI0027178582|nr:folylpolyglutamate synthase/dihydrofolate synthase family protein [Candidatus Binatus sp.]MDO8433341.1 folylpolyglutamate synthase/dihydrofolate synthase family protein [Candidatus Binatus sp.]
MDQLSKTIDWLFSLEARGEIYKLERMDAALDLIGNPHRKLRAVHIAGTKGKGSVAAILDSCLRAAGYRTGLYTKPHLVRLSERTRIAGAEIPAAQLLDYIERLRAIYERAGLALTFFEFTVAMMLLYFADAGVDVAVIETGLGGRLDSTNVVTPILSVITPIGFDHIEYLGHTIGAIAGEKGGIIKDDVPVVIGAREPDARLVLTSIAANRHSAVRLIERDFSYRSQSPAHRFDYHGLGLDLFDLEIGLAGPFQHENGAIAVAALEALRAQGWNIDEDSIRRGLRDIYWPGRFDIVSRNPTVILDCAHNEMSIAALLETMTAEFGAVKPRLIFGCLSDKDWPKMAAMLGPRVRDVTLTKVKPKRPLEPENLLPYFSAHAPARVEREPMAAVERVMSEIRADDVVLITGSVYLIGEVYPYFLARDGRKGLFPEADV